MSTIAKPAGHDRRLLMTMFGWNDSGGGTMLPRLIAKDLVRRGWEVSVFHAATRQLAGEAPYTKREWVDDGVRLVGIHNRPSALFDVGQPLRDLDDPAIRDAFRQELDHFRPDVVHFHNLHNLGASLIGEASAVGVPAFFTTHNYWLICQRAYLLHGTGEMCPGPGDGSRCAACAGRGAASQHKRRLSEIRARVQSGINRVFAVSESVRRTLIAAGYPADAISVVRQAMPAETEVWEAVGRRRSPGRQGRELTAIFVGSAYPHKGPQMLVEAAQRTEARLRVRIVGEIPPRFREQLARLDRRSVVEFTGAYEPGELATLLAEADVAVLPSRWWDCAPLAATECKAAGLPLVVPKLGGLPEVVRDEIDGLTFAGLDIDDLARQLDRLASEPGLLERLQAGIEAPSTFASHVDELESYYLGTHAGGALASAATPKLKASEVEVRWQGDHMLPTSLSIINDAVSARLPGPVQRVERLGHNLDAPLSHGADVEVHQEWPPNLSSPPAGRLAAIVPWEFGAVPTKWYDAIQSAVDELWVPSQFVRTMYLDAGVEPERVHAIPNGVDLGAFHPARTPRGDEQPLRFLFVGGITVRKGLDVLLAAFDEAFRNRDDVELLIKSAVAGGAYRGPGEDVVDRARSLQLPPVQLLDDDMDTAQLAELYRSADVFVLSYRAEGFAMPALEAMASGLPTILTEGGPTDEFCPSDAGWRIRAGRHPVDNSRLGNMETIGEPWMMEPDPEHLVEIFREVADTRRDELRRRGAIARAAAESFSWDEIAARYTERITYLASTPTRRVDRLGEPFQFEEDVEFRVLATPAWRGSDGLDALLCAWSASTTPRTSACLYLLADQLSVGTADELESHVLNAARVAGTDLESCADINVLVQPFTGDRDMRLHQSVNAYVPLHSGCAGHQRLAALAGIPVLRDAASELPSFLGIDER